jgi:hypothetical protein
MMQAALFCLLALIQSFNGWGLWRQYRLVKQGVAVYEAPEVELSVPKPVSIAATSILTGFVGVCSAIAITFAYTSGNTLTGWAIAGTITLALWLFTGRCWYRIVTERRKTPTVEPVYEQGEGVWPPAPRIPKNEGNGYP